MKNILKKSIVVLLAVSMVMSLAACGKGDKTAEKQKMTEEDKNSIYTYEELQLDESMKDMGNLRYAGDKMYSTLYHWDEETGESTQYFVICDKNGKEISRFVIPQGWDNNKSWGINNIMMTANGEIYGIDYTYESYEDTGTGNWVSKETFALIKMDDKGNVLWNVPLNEKEDQSADNNGNEDVDYYVINLQEDGNGNIWVFDTINYTSYDKDGNKGVSLKALENSDGQCFPTDEGNFVVGCWDENWVNLNFYELDTKTGKLGTEVLTMPGSYYQYSYYSGAGSQWDMYATNNIGVWAFNWGDEKMTKIMDYLLSDFPSTYINGIHVLSDDSFVGNYWDEEYNMVAATFTKVPADQVVDKYIIKLACYYMDNDVRHQVVAFNRSHEDIRITMDDYSVLNGEDNWDAGIEALNSDILAGKVPDILLVPAGMDLSIYTNKGLFTDLYKLMDKDETINKEDYLQNILALGEYNGELYELIPRFSALTLIGKTEDVGEGFGWTYDDMLALQSEKGQEANLFPTDYTRVNIMYYGMNLNFDQFYNANTGECNFNSPEFVQYLELLNQFPEELPENYWDDEDYWSTYETQWRSGNTILKYSYVSDFRSYATESQGYFGDKISYVGFPGKEGGSGSAASIDFTFAISEESAFKEEAWDFVSYFIKDEYQEKVYGFPVKLSALNKKAEEEQKPYMWENENGEMIEEESTMWINNEEIKIDEVTPEECAYVIEFLKNIDYRQKEISDITAIIEEDSAVYFDGQKSAKQVADTIQSRVKILVSERR